MKKLLILVMCFFLTGCWNYWELNDIAIITGVAIDKVGDEYLVSMMIANSKKPESNAKEGESLPTVYDGKGETITLAIEEISLKSSKKIYFSHMNALIISKEVALEGVYKVIDVLFRDPMSRKNFYVLIADKDKASNILKVVSPLESFPSQDISTTLTNASDMQLMSISISYDEFVSNLITDGIDPILPTIFTLGNVDEGESLKSLEKMEPAASVSLGNMALFKDDKLIYVTTSDESKGINLLRRKTGRIFLKLDCADSYIIIDAKEFKVDMNYTDKVKINIKAIATVKEVNCKIDLEDEKTIEKMEKESSKKLKEIVELSLSKAKELKVDIFGIGNLIYKENYNEYKKITDLDKFLETIEIKVTTDISIKAKGGIEQSIKEADDE